MKAVAVGDLLLPASVFDETIRSASWVTAYDSFDWDVTKKRDELRNVVRRMETGGSRAFLPTQEELEPSEGRGGHSQPSVYHPARGV